MIENKNLPAFPTPHGIDNGTVISQQIGESTWQAAGLTKREYFAGIAMQGIISGSYHQNEGWDQNGIDTMARDAVSFADAIIAELSKS